MTSSFRVSFLKLKCLRFSRGDSVADFSLIAAPIAGKGISVGWNAVGKPALVWSAEGIAAQTGYKPAINYALAGNIELGAAQYGGTWGVENALAWGASIKPITPYNGYPPLGVPQGFTESQYQQMIEIVRQKSIALGLGDDIFVQGSRAGGYAKPWSDIDFGIRVPADVFNNYLFNSSKLCNANLNSANFNSLLYSIDRGIIKSGEARLSPTARKIEALTGEFMQSTPFLNRSSNGIYELTFRRGIEVDLSIIRAGEKFDVKPQISLPKGYSK